MRHFSIVLSLLLMGVPGQAAEKVLRAISYNVWALPGIQLRMPERLPDIASTLPFQGADVIAFQEAFNKRAAVLARMPEYPHVAWGPGGSFLRPQSSGLLLASRWPILRTATHIYSQCWATDCFSNKGVLFARLQVDGIGEVDVYTTHLAFGPGHNTRIAQARELRQFIRRHSSGDRPIIVLGDFNFTAGTQPYQDMRTFLQLRDAHQEFVDAHPELSQDEKEGITFDPERNPNIGFKGITRRQRIDLALFKDQGGTSTRVDRSEVLLDSPHNGRFLSDHFALGVDFRIRTID